MTGKKITEAYIGKVDYSRVIMGENIRQIRLKEDGEKIRNC